MHALENSKRKHAHDFDTKISFVWEDALGFLISADIRKQIIINPFLRFAVSSWLNL